MKLELVGEVLYLTMEVDGVLRLLEIYVYD